MDNRQLTGKLIVVFALVSALLPSIPTILKYWKDREEIEIPLTGIKMAYQKFLFFWLIISFMILIFVWKRVK